jgi:hypothetical protein
MRCTLKGRRIVTAISAVIAMIVVLIVSEAADAACLAAPAGYKGFRMANFPAGDDKTVSADGLNFLVHKESFATWISDTPVIDSWICASFWFPEASPDADFAGGVVFWKRDAQNFYIAVARRKGSFAIVRHTAAGWRNIKAGASDQSSIVRAGPGTHNPQTYNQIEVVTLGDFARVLINDREVMEMKSMVGANETEAGIYAEADADRDYRWLFESVSITSLCHSGLKGYC